MATTTIPAPLPLYVVDGSHLVWQRFADGSYGVVGEATGTDEFTPGDVAEALADLGRALDLAAQRNQYSREAGLLDAIYRRLPGVAWAPGVADAWA